MDILQAGILGLVEGLTEFLPVSSTFHLIWTAKILNVEQTPFVKLFEIAIQSGAILAVVVSFAKTTLQNPSLIKKVIVAFIPTAVIGFVLYKIIKDIFLENMMLQICMFIAIGIIFILFERFRSRSLDRAINSITYTEAITIGTMQALAVIPGVSRSGAVILTLMVFAFNRKDAAVFSFLLAVPTILAATVFDILKSHEAISGNQNIFLLAVGFVVACATAHLVVRWLLKYLENHTLSAFGWYRVVAGLTLLIFLLN